MSTTYNSYISRNEVSMSMDTYAPVIELEHTSSLIRKFSFGSNWNKLHIRCRLAVSGSPTTGNMTGCSSFIGLCNETKRFSSGSAKATSHCVGYVQVATGTPTNLAGGTQTAYTIATATDPASVTTAFAAAGYFMNITTGSVRNYGQSNQMSLQRYETNYSASVGPNKDYIGKCFAPFLMSIEKKPGGWVFNQISNNIVTAADRVTCSIAVPFDVTACHDVSGDLLSSLNLGLPYQPILNIIPGATAVAITSQNDVIAAAASSPDEVLLGAMDSLNIYWRCDSYPQAKLLIKDIMVYRYF